MLCACLLGCSSEGHDLTLQSYELPCGDGGACESGTSCVNNQCVANVLEGECEVGESRACRAPCGGGTQQCVTGHWGRCECSCGNGTVEGAEMCDDANAFDGDGCSSVCTIEAGATCQGTTPSECYFRSCAHARATNPSAPSGIYVIRPQGLEPMPVYCDMAFEGGGWTLCAHYEPDNAAGVTDIRAGFGDPNVYRREQTGARHCEELLSRSEGEVLLRAGEASFARFAGAVDWSGGGALERKSWPGDEQGDFLLEVTGPEHIFGYVDPDYARTGTCGDFSPQLYELAINRRYHGSNNFTCADERFSGVAELGIHDVENCGLCACNWSDCWQDRTAVAVDLYVR